MTAVSQSISSTFIWRRVHSLTGLWLVLYLFFHLMVNSQAALWIGGDGHGFVQLVNSLESLPYLQAIETVFIGIPLLVHAVWGIKRALSAKTNASGRGGSFPVLKESRNRAFTWQRITSWILLFGVLGHVVQMRFLEMPEKVYFDNKEHFVVKLQADEGLYTLASRMGVVLYHGGAYPLEEGPAYTNIKQQEFDARQREEQAKKWAEMLAIASLNDCEVLAVSDESGKAILFMVRETFKSPLMCVLYTIFVLAAAFHACNGFWTALITWGAILSYRSQLALRPVVWIGAALLIFFGLAAIWGSFWINLRA